MAAACIIGIGIGPGGPGPVGRALLVAALLCALASGAHGVVARGDVQQQQVLQDDLGVIANDGNASSIPYAPDCAQRLSEASLSLASESDDLVCVEQDGLLDAGNLTCTYTLTQTMPNGNEITMTGTVNLPFSYGKLCTASSNPNFACVQDFASLVGPTSMCATHLEMIGIRNKAAVSSHYAYLRKLTFANGNGHGLDVRSSTRLTFNTSQISDWVLEVAPGRFESALVDPATSAPTPPRRITRAPNSAPSLLPHSIAGVALAVIIPLLLQNP